MPFYERLIGIEEPKIAVHQYVAAVHESQRGKLSKQTIADLFLLDADEKVESDRLADRFVAVVSPITGEETQEILLLAEARLMYNTVESLKARLGV